jgi:hypothetical protein
MKAKRIASGLYEYRGFILESQGTPSYPSWAIIRKGDEYSEDYRDTLAYAKEYVDTRIEVGKFKGRI